MAQRRDWYVGFYVHINAAAPGVTLHMHWHVYGPVIP